jgi:hypothetical protein
MAEAFNENHVPTLRVRRATGVEHSVRPRECADGVTVDAARMDRQYGVVDPAACVAMRRTKGHVVKTAARKHRAVAQPNSIVNGISLHGGDDVALAERSRVLRYSLAC